MCGAAVNALSAVLPKSSASRKPRGVVHQKLLQKWGAGRQNRWPPLKNEKYERREKKPIHTLLNEIYNSGTMKNPVHTLLDGIYNSGTMQKYFLLPGTELQNKLPSQPKVGAQRGERGF